MIDVVVCDTNQEDMEIIREDCFEYCFEKNYEAEIYGFSDVNEAKKFLTKRDIRITCMLACGIPVDALIENVRTQNQRNYVILIAQDIKELVMYMNPVVRPVGCLIKPVRKADVCAVVHSIEQDLKREEPEEDVFQFRIRSKEYYVECSQILMFEALSKKIVLYTAVQEYEFYDSFGHILESLPEYFIRSHKSFIINLKKVRQVDYKNLEIFLEEDLTADLSRAAKTEFSEKLSRYKGGQTDGDRI